MLDLQLHTTDSDGTWPWQQVLEQCLTLGLTAFAITDHDTIIRQAEIRAWAKSQKAQAIPGVELSTRESDQSVHLLGYFLEGPLERLESKLAYLRMGRGDRNKKIIERLQKLGLKVTEEELIKVAGRATVGRPHIARLLLEKGYVQSIKEAFDRYLALDGSAYFPKDELPLREGIDLLHEAGCVTSVAHPLLLNRAPDVFEASLRLWRSWGLDAVEAIYPMYKPEQSTYMVRTAEKYGYLITGGSDFHGENKPHIKIGTGTGNLNVPDGVLEPLMQRKEEICRHSRMS
jgi:3',5'-nucleoside bisphosphate phosphatase